MTLNFHGLSPLFSVYDMPESIRFYRDLLGFEVVSSSPPLPPPHLFHWAMLRHGAPAPNTVLMLNTAYESDDERPPTRSPLTFEAHGDTCLYIACPDVDGAYHFLQSRGLKLAAPRVAPYGMKQLYLKDPDGYQLCLQWPV